MKKLLGETDGTMNTIIGKDTVITGTLDVKGGLRVDGTAKGKVICDESITIGPTGVVESEIEAGTIIIAGRLVGNINSAEKVELQAKCEVEGDIHTKSLVIEQGAIFCGACNMKDQQPDLGFLARERRETVPSMDSEDDENR
ncbi:MAG TPA: polymer-forming cytoskeletal protein [candidate division Zixibacteria bacterium]|nr:polymer-forming cytoskeletal protein [candidate division Zixibacteria bacterium]